MVNEFVLGVAIILLTGLLFGKLSRKLRIPDITGYLLGGLVIGPTLVTLIVPAFSGIIGFDLLETLALVVDIELGFIAFAVGCEFKISYFKQVGLMPIIIAFTESLAAVIFITGGMLLFGAPLYFALCMGAVGGATAPAATIMVIRQYKAKGDLAKTLLSVTAIDDASALLYFGIAIAIVKAIIMPGANIAWTVITPIIEILGSLAIGLVIGFAFTFLLRFFKSESNRLVLTVAMLFLSIGLCLLIKETFDFGFSSLLVCIVMGAVFTNMSKEVEQVAQLTEAITPPLVVIFFVLAGAGLQVEALSWLALTLLCVYLVFRVAGKVFGTWISAKAAKAPPIVKKWLGWGLLPQGGIAIGLSILVMKTLDAAPAANLTAGYDGVLVRAIVLCAVFASEIFGPLLAKMAIIKSGEGQEEPRPPKREKKQKQQGDKAGTVISAESQTSLASETKIIALEPKTVPVAESKSRKARMTKNTQEQPGS